MIIINIINHQMIWEWFFPLHQLLIGDLGDGLVGDFGDGLVAGIPWDTLISSVKFEAEVTWDRPILRKLTI